MKMSFYNGTLNKVRAKILIANTSKEIRYTSGLKYRNPVTYEVPISKDKAINIINSESLINIDFNSNDFIDIQVLSSNDMW